MKSFSESAKAANLLYVLSSRALSGRDGALASRPKLHGCLSTACQLLKKLCSLLTITAPIIIMSLQIFVCCRSNHVPGGNDYKANLIANMACQKVLDRLFSWVKDFRRCEGSFYGLAEVCHMIIDCNVDESDQGMEGIPLHYFKAIGEGDDLSVCCTFYVITSLTYNASGLVAIDLKLRGRLDLVP